MAGRCFRGLITLILGLGFALAMVPSAQATTYHKDDQNLGDEYAYAGMMVERQNDGHGWWVLERDWEADGNFNDPCTRDGSWAVRNAAGNAVEGPYSVNLQREFYCEAHWDADIKVDSRCVELTIPATYRRQFQNDLFALLNPKVCHQ